MTKIQILGSGCDKCRKLAANAKLAAEQLNLPFEMEKSRTSTRSLHSAS